MENTSLKGPVSALRKQVNSDYRRIVLEGRKGLEGYRPKNGHTACNGTGILGSRVIKEKGEDKRYYIPCNCIIKQMEKKLNGEKVATEDEA